MGEYAKCPLCKLSRTPFRDGHIPRLVDCERCGTYALDESFLNDRMDATDAPAMPALSGLAREYFLVDQQLLITKENYKDLIRRAPTTMSGKTRKLILAMAKEPPGYNHTYFLSTEPSLAYAATDSEFRFILESLHRRQIAIVHFDGQRVNAKLLHDGWMEVERHEVKETDKVFVAMWFDPSQMHVFTDGIAPACEQTGYRGIRVDGKEHVGKVDDQIIAEIKESRFVIADFTGHRGGVYFEAGYAQGMGLPVIWSCHKDHLEKLHFDIRQYNCIVWKDADELKTRLINRIRAVIGARK